MFNRRSSSRKRTTTGCYGRIAGPAAGEGEGAGAGAMECRAAHRPARGVLVHLFNQHANDGEF